MPKINPKQPSELDIFKHQIASDITVIICELEQQLIDQDVWPETVNERVDLVQQLVDTAPDHLRRALEAANTLSQQLVARDKVEDFAHHEVFNLQETVRETCQQWLKPYPVNKMIEVAEIVDYQLYGDKTRLKLVLTHLLNNAAEAYDKKVAEKKIEILGRMHHGGALLVIIDQGRGMSEKTKAQAQQLNFSTKPNSKGIGLWEAEQIICQEFDGSLNIISQVDKGTFVFIFL